MPDYPFMRYMDTVKLFRDERFDVIELHQGKLWLATVPQLGDRVIAISYAGRRGKNPFYVVEDDIRRNLDLPFPYAVGMHEWTGPEGCGDMTLYHRKFEKGKLLPKNWMVQQQVNTPGFEVKYQNNILVTSGDMSIQNLRGNQFYVGVGKVTFLLGKEQAESSLNTDLSNLEVAGVQRSVTYKNQGSIKWNSKHGYLSIWTLSMIGSDSCTEVFVPHYGGRVSPVRDLKFDGSKIPDDIRVQFPGVDAVLADGTR